MSVVAAAGGTAQGATEQAANLNEILCIWSSKIFKIIKINLKEVKYTTVTCF